MFHPWVTRAFEGAGATAFGALLFFLLVYGFVRVLAAWEKTKPAVQKTMDLLFGPIFEEGAKSRIDEHADRELDDRISESVEEAMNSRLPSAVKAEVDSRMEDYQAEKAAELEVKMAELQRKEEMREERANVRRGAVLESLATNAAKAAEMARHPTPLSNFHKQEISLAAWEEGGRSSKRKSMMGHFGQKSPESSTGWLN